MKIITLPNGKKEKMYKPHEAAVILDYHPRTIRRFLQTTKQGKKTVPPRIKAVNSNKSGKQPVWWIPESEINRLKKELTGK